MIKKADEKKLRFLIVSKWGDLLDLANAIKLEGHTVKMCIEYGPAKKVGDGFVSKVSKWRAYIDWADIVIFDYTGYGKDCQELMKMGKPVIGGTPYVDSLELDRNFGQNELKKHGIKILRYKKFDHTDDAIEYVKNHPNKYVIKPCGEMQDNKQLLFVGQEEDGSDIIRILQAYQKTWGNELGTFQLQVKVSGVEVSVAAFFNGKEFIKPINVTFEHKKLFPKDLGVSTGEMGTSMFWVDENPIFEATLKKMEQTLAADGFVGHIDVNSIVNGNGIYPLEFTSRFGFPQIQIQRAGIAEPIGQLLYKVATGQSFKIKTKKGFQVGLYMVVPPFPFNDKATYKLFSEDAVVVFKKNKMEGVHPMHVRKINDEWLITGGAGIAVLVTGTGITMKEAQTVMYNRVNNVVINNSYYRTDIGDRWYLDADRLWAWNLL